jgi:hypothetical protein
MPTSTIWWSGVKNHNNVPSCGTSAEARIHSPHRSSPKWMTLKDRNRAAAPYFRLDGTWKAVFSLDGGAMPQAEELSELVGAIYDRRSNRHYGRDFSRGPRNSSAGPAATLFLRTPRAERRHCVLLRHRFALPAALLREIHAPSVTSTPRSRSRSPSPTSCPMPSFAPRNCEVESGACHHTGRTVLRCDIFAESRFDFTDAKRVHRSILKYRDNAQFNSGHTSALDRTVLEGRILFTAVSCQKLSNSPR